MITYRRTHHMCLLAILALLAGLSPFVRHVSAGESGEQLKLFNGKNLDGWKGDPKVWSVRDGAIVGSSVDHTIEANTFLVWQGGKPRDFILTYKARLEGDNNSGVQYRSKLADPKTWKVIGYQADMHSKPEYAAMLYGEGTGRGIIAERGTKATLETEPSKSSVDKSAFEVKVLDLSQWHTYEIIAKGNRLIHKLDGKITVDVTDNHDKALQSGIIALQVHAGQPMTVYFKDIWLEELSDKPRD